VYMMKKQDINRYIIVFFITLAVFITAGTLSSFFNQRKINEVKKIQDKISIDILSNETQFQLLQELSCKDVSKSTLSKELNELADKITYSETNIKNQDDVNELKRYYGILQIKDYLLSKKLKEKCKINTESIFYFYTTKENCTECDKQAIVLTQLRQKYPDLRVYSFDYNSSLSALQTLVKIFKISDKALPALVINEDAYTGFKSAEDIEKLLPALVLEKKKQDEEKARLLKLEESKK
jgi:thiol-disulfide isomerase/thioredoxin